MERGMSKFSFIKKIFGSKNDRDVKRLGPLVKRINEHEAALQPLSEEDLRQKTAQWKAELSQIQDPEALAARLNDILPEAYAVVKDACRRLCGTEIIVREHPLKWEMIPFDVQLVGAVALHQGKIAEMATGEGKTLVATMPVFLNALTGRGVHVVTVNDYLAARDSEWMGAVYRFLGLTVGCIIRDQSPAVRRDQYNCDITLRHQLGIRLRLLARQRHGHAARGPGAARALFRHRGRSGFDPD